MSGTKKHIDKLFAEGFKNFSLLVSNKDFEAIDDKTSQFREQENKATENIFGSFELEVNESDWLSTKAKLDNEKAVMAQDNFMSDGLKDLELEVKPDDWTKTYIKLRAAKKRRVAYWWWLSAGIIILGLGSFFMSRQFQSEAVPVLTENVQSPADGNIEQPVIAENPNGSDNGSGQTDVKTDHHIPSNEQNLAKENPVNSANPGNNTIAKSTHSNTRNHFSQPEITSNANTSNADHSSLKDQQAKDIAEQIERRGNTVESNHIIDMPVADQGLKKELQEVITDKKEDAEKSLADNKEVENKSGNEELQNKTVEPADTSKKKSDPVKPPVKLPKNKLYVAAVTQVGSTFRHLDKLNNAKYNSIRNDAEKPFTQLTYGIEMGIRKKKSQLSIGIQGTTQSWASSYKYSYRIYDSIPYIDINGKVHYFLVNPRDTSINEQQVIKITKVQIPFEFTQFWTLNSKLNLLTTFGGTIGFTTNMEGNKILNPSNNFLYPYQQMKQYERKVSFVPSLSFGIEYRLNKSFVLQGAAFGNYSATSRFNNDFPAKDFPYTIGGSLKLLYFIK